VPARDLARASAYLPQDRTVHWSLPCERVVGLGRLPHRRFSAAESAADAAAIAEAMASMDVSQFAERPIATLSGGERARVLVARALAQQARYIATDEPTAGLDPAHSLRLFAEFKRLSQKGHAIVTALHDLSLAARYATRVVLLKDGRCIASGPTAQVLSKENLANAFSVDAFVTEIEGFPVVLPVTPLT
jgi:iron complex transport system ATP-binding protein